MSEKNAKKAADPFANFTAEDNKLFALCVKALGAAEKASEALNRALGAAYRAGLHTKSGFSNFGKWTVAAFAARGISISKSKAYNAIKISDVRAMAKAAETLPDTVVLRIAETVEMGDPERVAAFVDEVVKTGGTVDSVRAIAKGDEDTRAPEDRLAASIADRVGKFCKGDIRGVEAILKMALELVKADYLDRVKA